jgi:hypothetical protein
MRQDTAEARAKPRPEGPSKADGPQGEPGGEAKPGKGAEGKAAAEEKSPGAPMPGESRGDGKGAGKPADQGEKTPGAPMPPQRQGQNGQGEAKGKGKHPAGNQPGEGAPGPRRPSEPGAQDAGHEPPVERSKPEASRASVEQLERFRKKVDKDVLKDMKMSEEDYRRFLKAYEEMVERQGAGKPAADEDPAPGGASSLPSTGSKRERPGAKGAANDGGTGGAALPPPPYRDAYREFTKKLATPDR